MLIDDIRNYKVYLVSKSPRRHELLSGMGIEFEYLATHVEEIYSDCLSPVEVAEYLSQLKLSPIDRILYPSNTIFIACDTIVVLEDKIIEKPKDELDAFRMLSELSGRKHVVISGLTVATPFQSITSHGKTEVIFKYFSEEELQYYVARYKPLDKAGAYGVQEWIGYVGIDSINGSFYNVMGLPTKLLWDILAQLVRKH
ncbi:MAG: Maf family protein [Bacteroidales bacterium]